MDAPKCRLCGQRHWSGCALPFVASPKNGGSATVDGKTLVHEHNEQPVMAGDLKQGETYEIDLSGPQPVLRAPRGTFDRNAYQREYMRKRRAADKLK